MRLAAIVLLATLVLAACGFSSAKTAPGPSANTPEGVARSYVAALKQGDCQTVTGLLSTEYKTRLGGDAAAGQWCSVATQHADIVPASDVTALAPQTTGADRAAVPVTFTDVAGSVQQQVVDTVKEGNSWKVLDVRTGSPSPSPSPSASPSPSP